ASPAAARAASQHGEAVVSRNTVRNKVRISELTEELAVGAALRLRCDSDDIRSVVEAVVAYLVEEYPAQDLYIPASMQSSAYPVEAIRKGMQEQESVRSLCRRFRIDRRTLYRLLDEPCSNG
ncbi:hypothetical protein, partial [Stenotrophomonas sp. GD04064]|uniref:hypothetical protein n=1 Tax=Stenotrophomonas sp. GD04064 TaxID=2975430 RepID=UPI00244971EA